MKRLLLNAVLTVLALTVPPGYGQVMDSSSHTGLAPNGVLPPGLDGVFMKHNAELPGFGGYFFDEGGDLVVQLQDLSQEDRARVFFAAVANNRPERVGRPWARPAELRVREVEFEFKQLLRWRSSLENSNAADILETDCDEERNRVFVGVPDEAARRRVTAAEAALGIPAHAVDVHIVSPAEPISTLNDPRRPLAGGLRLDFGLTQCTLGANVYYGNWAQNIPPGTRGFLTAAHCSNQQGATDGVTYWQGDEPIGHERYDPPFFTPAQDPNCPLNMVCRWSDVTFAIYDIDASNPNLVHQGALLQTLWRYMGTGADLGLIADSAAFGSREINPTLEEFVITQGVLPVQGMPLDKIGYVTGWTEGAVTKTCKNEQPAGGKYILCSDEVAAYAFNGDSGAPIFQLTGQSTAAFSGIVWAKKKLDDGRIGLLFSNTSQIARDFGTLISYMP